MWTAENRRAVVVRSALITPLCLIGAPGAAERATMLTVMLSSNIAASLVTGGVIGLLLSGRREV
jgi:hypothetical protein